MNQKEYLGELTAAEDLEKDIQNEADRKALDELRAGAAEKRRQDRATDLGHSALVQTNDGAIVEQAALQQAIEQGHEASGPYNGGAHSAN